MNWLKVLVAFSALVVAGCAAYFSVTGLGVLFSGASIAVMVMAGSLEFAKLVTASYLKQKWDEIQLLFKIYLTTAVVILMVITSAGIFGYLSNAFQQQNLKIGQIEREIAVWQQRIDQTDKEIERYNKQLEGQIKIRESQEQNIRTSTESGKSVSRYTGMVKTADAEIKRISDKVTELNDNNSKYYEEINKIRNSNMEVEREVGGFRFVADAFGLDLNYVVKFFIFLIVFVFDPLALALVIAFNQLNDTKRRDKTDTNRLYAEKETKVETKPNDTTNRLYEVYGEKETEVETDDTEDYPAPNEKLVEAFKEYNEVVNVSSNANEEDIWGELSELETPIEPKVDEEKKTLDALKASPAGTRSEIVVDGKVIGYDTDGDGLPNETAAKSSIQAREFQTKKPYYTLPDFNWSNKANWINDQNAVNYWLKYKRRELETNDNIKSY